MKVPATFHCSSHFLDIRTVYFFIKVTTDTLGDAKTWCIQSLIAAAFMLLQLTVSCSMAPCNMDYMQSVFSHFSVNRSYDYHCVIWLLLNCLLVYFIILRIFLLLSSLYQHHVCSSGSV